MITSGLKHSVYTVNRRFLKGRLYLGYKCLCNYSRIMRMTQRPIIIGGCGRSGTTLLLSLLSCHPNIHAIPQETYALCPTAYTESPNYDADFYIEVLYGHLLRDNIPDSCTRWCEKTPRNTFYIQRILDYFGEGTRFINVVRDGRDVITSSHPRVASEYFVPPARWVASVSEGLRFEDHAQVLTVRYEDIVSDWEAVAREICDFSDEPFCQDLLKYPENAKVLSSKAWVGPAIPLHQRSIRRWEDDRHAEVVERLMGLPKAVELLGHYRYIA